MIARQTVFRGDAPDDDATLDDPYQTAGTLAIAAVAHHTKCVREWLAAPVSERAHCSERLKSAWQELRRYGMSSQSAAALAANGVMRANQKLRGHQ